MSAMGHGCSVTMSSMPMVLRWQNCVGGMFVFLLEKQLSHPGWQIGDDDGCQDSRLGTDIPCILCTVGLAANAVCPALLA